MATRTAPASRATLDARLPYRGESSGAVPLPLQRSDPSRARGTADGASGHCEPPAWTGPAGGRRLPIPRLQTYLSNLGWSRRCRRSLTTDFLSRTFSQVFPAKKGEGCACAVPRTRVPRSDPLSDPCALCRPAESKRRCRQAPRDSPQRAPPNPTPGQGPQGCERRNVAGVTRDRAQGGRLGLPLMTVSPQGPHPAREEQGFE